MACIGLQHTFPWTRASILRKSTTDLWTRVRHFQKGQPSTRLTRFWRIWTFCHVQHGAYPTHQENILRNYKKSHWPISCSIIHNYTFIGLVALPVSVSPPVQVFSSSPSAFPQPRYTKYHYAFRNPVVHDHVKISFLRTKPPYVSCFPILDRSLLQAPRRWLLLEGLRGQGWGINTLIPSTSSPQPK